MRRLLKKGQQLLKREIEMKDLICPIALRLIEQGFALYGTNDDFLKFRPFAVRKGDFDERFVDFFSCNDHKIRNSSFNERMV